MTEAEWLACDAFEELFRQLESTALPTQRKLRLFEVARQKSVHARSVAGRQRLEKCRVL